MKTEMTVTVCDVSHLIEQFITEMRAHLLTVDDSVMNRYADDPNDAAHAWFLVAEHMASVARLAKESERWASRIRETILGPKDYGEPRHSPPFMPAYEETNQENETNAD